MESQISYLEPDEIINIYEILTKVNIDKLLTEIDFDKLNERDIYPENWANTQEMKEYVKLHFINLEGFFKRAVDDKHIIIVHKPQ